MKTVGCIIRRRAASCSPTPAITAGSTAPAKNPVKKYSWVDLSTVLHNLFGTGDWFHGRHFSQGQKGGEDGFRMIQSHYIYCALYFYYHYISSTSDH